MKKILFILALIFIGFSCKSDKKDNQPNTVEQKKETNEQVAETPFFTVKLIAKVEKDDKFKLLYTEDTGVPFVGKQVVRANVKGSEEFQTIEFKFKEKDIKPIRLRLDIGNNKDQKTITIKSLEFAHNDDYFIVQDSLLKRFFSPNKHIEFTKDAGVVKLMPEGDKYAPFFVSKKPLHDKLFQF